MYFTIKRRNSTLPEHMGLGVFMIVSCNPSCCVWSSPCCSSVRSWRWGILLVYRLPFLSSCRVIMLMLWFGDGSLKCHLSSSFHPPSWGRAGGMYPKSLHTVCSKANLSNIKHQENQHSSHLSGPNEGSCLILWQTSVWNNCSSFCLFTYK